MTKLPFKVLYIQNTNSCLVCIDTKLCSNTRAGMKNEAEINFILLIYMIIIVECFKLKRCLPLVELLEVLTEGALGDRVEAAERLAGLGDLWDGQAAGT